MNLPASSRPVKRTISDQKNNKSMYLVKKMENGANYNTLNISPSLNTTRIKWDPKRNAGSANSTKKWPIISKQGTHFNVGATTKS